MSDGSKKEKWAALILILTIVLHVTLSFIGSYNEFKSGIWSGNFLITQFGHVVLLVIAGAAVVFLFSFNKKLNEKYGRLRLKMVEQNRERDRDRNEFLSLAAHQLRTPLSAAKWLIELLLEGGNLTSEQQSKLNDLYRSNERMIFLISDLLSVSKIDGAAVLSLQMVDIAEIIRGAASDLKLEAAKQNKTIKLELKEVWLPLDLLKFNGAFRNVLDNAVAYSSPGSEIAVVAKRSEDNYQISVHNFGSYIKESEKEYIFKKFYRSKEAIKFKTAGSGLGLFIAKQIIEAHEGKIWFESSKDRGTTFFINLPLNLEKL